MVMVYPRGVRVDVQVMSMRLVQFSSMLVVEGLVVDVDDSVFVPVGSQCRVHLSKVQRIPPGPRPYLGSK